MMDGGEVAGFIMFGVGVGWPGGGPMGQPSGDNHRKTESRPRYLCCRITGGKVDSPLWNFLHSHSVILFEHSGVSCEMRPLPRERRISVLKRTQLRDHNEV